MSFTQGAWWYLKAGHLLNRPFFVPVRFHMDHVFKILLIVFNFVFNHNWFFKILGWLNKYAEFLSIIFVAYPATKGYASKYAYPKYHKYIKYTPYIIGVFKQNGKWGLNMAISGKESDFINKDTGKIYLKSLYFRTEEIRRLTMANQKNFAGILPGLMFMNRIVSEVPEADVTVDVIIKAEKIVRELEKYSLETPLIILGGKGFIGRRLIKALKSVDNNRSIIIVDINNSSGTNLKAWPSELKGEKAILINLTRKSVLFHYISLFWPDLILLNEVYPEPDENELELLRQNSITAYHVVGVKAKSFPAFPKGYKGGIPCCAARRDINIEVIVKNLYFL